MEVAIIHLTDIHFTEKTDINSRIHPLCQAIIKELRGKSRAYFILSGDIAFSGKNEEYGRAIRFLSNIKLLISNELKELSFKYVIVPGNHDCDFVKKHNQLRGNAVKNINYQYLGNDNSVVDACIDVQDEFWKFYEKYNPVPADRLFYSISDMIDGKSIVFHCINTAWMSSLHEEPGSLFFPVARYIQALKQSPGLHIGVWHHPYNWFTPQTKENNNKEFEQFTEQIASTHFFGHEHESSFYAAENRSSGKKVNLLSGELFNDDRKKNSSGFQTMIVNLDTEQGLLTRYTWSEDYYAQTDSKEISLKRETYRSFRLKDEFERKLEEIHIPLTIDGRRDIKQSEIFVFPDLDSDTQETKGFDSYISSSKLVESELRYCVIQGETQIGKTALLFMLYLNMYRNGMFPILLVGKDLKDDNLEKVIKRNFRQQYKVTDVDFDKFMQLGFQKKVLLIDDYQDSRFNSQGTMRLFEQASKLFGKAIIMVDSTSIYNPSIHAEFVDVQYFNIKPLGYKKRDEIIKKYELLKVNQYTVNDQDFFDTVKTSFDNVQSILGDKLMPSYPIYIISILQALEYKPINQNETSFGYCYQTLIHYSLHKAGVANEDIDAYFNFLTELAYFVVFSETEMISNKELQRFYVKYSDQYICPSYETVIRALRKAKILQDEGESIKFGYNYILYYLSAKKIADLLHTEEGVKITERLFEELHIEKNANILVFITHHSKVILRRTAYCCVGKEPIAFH